MVVYFHSCVWIKFRGSEKKHFIKKKKVPTKKSYNPIKIAKGLFASFLLFVLCWLPYGLLILIDSNNELPAAAYMYSMTLAHLSPTLNPILYALTNSQIKNGYLNFFNLIFFRKKYKYAWFISQKNKKIMKDLINFKL